MTKSSTALESQSSPPTRHSIARQAVPLTLALAASLLISISPLNPFTHSAFTSTTNSPNFSHLHYSKQCPGLEFISTEEFTDRRTNLGKLLRGEEGDQWGAYVSEPSPNTLYYTNLSQSSWYLSERPWTLAITPSGPNSSHLSVLTPSFEVSRSQRLPFALNKEDFEKVSWVAWKEEEDPYRILVEHLESLKEADGFGEGQGWTIHLEENVRQFVSAGLQAAGQQIQNVKPKVELAALVVREQRMRKTENELALQRCAGKVTLEALRTVRRLLTLGMTEKDGEAFILDALTAAGLTDLDSIVLFGENAALPHASAGDERRLKEGDFALFDVGGALGGYFSDYTRTMLPDLPSRGSHGRMTKKQQWPSARAEKIWKTVHRAQEAALKVLESEEVYAAEVDRAAREVIEEEGWGERFTHRVGHG
ncbi:hypothetical protein P7C70_g9013, partial [Phenoliferia sp. Uapishka_3]